jgi:hypothetical protein
MKREEVTAYSRFMNYKTRHCRVPTRYLYWTQEKTAVTVNHYLIECRTFYNIWH